MTRSRTASLSLLVLLALPAAAWAQSEEEARQQARQSFQEGERLFDDGQFEEALAEFQQSYLAIPHVATRFNVAKCLEELGRLVEADDAFKDVEHGDDEDLAASARDARARIGRKIATLTVRTATGVPVTVDGESCPFPCETRVDPGEHALVVGTGEEAHRQSVTLAEGESRTIDATDVVAGSPIDSELYEGEASVSTRGLTTDKLLLWGGVGLAAVGVTMTLVFGLRASSLESEVEDARYSGPDPDDVDAGETAATLANVGLVATLVGAGLAATGFVLGMDDGDENPDRMARLEIVPGGLVLRGSFR